MCRFLERALVVAMAGCMPCAALAQGSVYSGIGRSATPAEVKAWDIDVRPDFAGLPKGSGSVEFGQQVWEGRCAGCHGTFGESNEVFAPLVGGTTAEDIRTGRAATLASAQPVRTTLSKVATLSTLWDYINRAMPWTAPKSLSPDEVYAVLAYLLNLGEIVPTDFTLGDANIREVQDRLPNRNGMTRDHGLWDTRGKPDVRNVACMKDCATEPRVASFLPDDARNNHGNLADQNRPYGAIRGQATSGEASGATAASANAAGKAAGKAAAALSGSN